MGALDNDAVYCSPQTFDHCHRQSLKAFQPTKKDVRKARWLQARKDDSESLRRRIPFMFRTGNAQMWAREFVRGD